MRLGIRAAKKYGINFIRLSPDKFLSKNRDFLIGNADNYTHIADDDLQDLKLILDICVEEKMPDQKLLDICYHRLNFQLTQIKLLTLIVSWYRE